MTSVVILGAGAVGCYLGAHLALAGLEVTMAVRGRAREAIERDGVRLHGPRGDWQVRRLSATDRPDQACGADLLLSCVKLYDATDAARQWQVALESAAVVVSLQNGVDGVERTLAGAPHARCLGGLAYVAGRLAGPGVVDYVSDMSSIVFGGAGATRDARLLAFRDAVTVGAAAGAPPLQVDVVEDIAHAQWRKFMSLATNAALTCLTRSPAGVIYRDPELLALARQSIAEVRAVAAATGVSLTDAEADDALSQLRKLPPQMFASMHHDLAAGRPLELDGLSGTVLRLGRQHGVATPFHQFAHACLKPHAHGSPQGR